MPIAATAVERTLLIVAHPDDAEFWAGGTIGAWKDAGITVTLLRADRRRRGGSVFTPVAVPKTRPGRSLGAFGSGVACGIFSAQSPNLRRCSPAAAMMTALEALIRAGQLTIVAANEAS